MSRYSARTAATSISRCSAGTYRITCCDLLSRFLWRFAASAIYVHFRKYSQSTTFRFGIKRFQRLCRTGRGARLRRLSDEMVSLVLDSRRPFSLEARDINQGRTGTPQGDLRGGARFLRLWPMGNRGRSWLDWNIGEPFGWLRPL